MYALFKNSNKQKTSVAGYAEGYRYQWLVAGLILMLVLVLFLLAYLYPLSAWPFLFVVSALAAYMIVRLRIESILMKVMAFLLPFSVEIPFLEGSMLRIPTEPLIALSALVLLVHVLAKGRSLNAAVMKEIFWIIPLATVFIIAIFFSEMPLVSIKFSFVNIMYIISFYVMMMVLSMDKPRLFPQMVLLYGLGFMVVALWATYQYWQYDWNPVTVRGIFQPFYKDHTIFGASAALLTMFWATAASVEDRPVWRIVAWALAGLFFFGVLLSGSRGAYLSLLFAAMTWLIFYFKLRPRHLLMLVFALLVAGWALRGQISDRLPRTEIVSYDHDANLIDKTRSVANVSTDVSNIERINRWVSAWRMFRERPLTGFGPGTYQFQYIPYQEPALETRLTVTDPWNTPEGSGGTAHSEYLLALSEMGIFGLGALLLLMARWFWLAMKRWREYPGRHHIVVACVALSTYYFHAMVNNFLTTDKFAFLFWGTAAWLIVQYHGNALVKKRA